MRDASASTGPAPRTRPVLMRLARVAASALLIALCAGTALSPHAATAQETRAGAGTDALARQFQAGVEAYDAGDYARAFELWLPLARNGDLAAQRNVAHLLRRGLGVEKDLPRALEFYRRSAEYGFVTAQVNLAAMLLAGEGTDPDPAEAAKWFDRAARAGHPLAQYNMGVLYERGLGVAQDLPRALGWYAVAARGGSKAALDRLAELVPTLPGPGAPAQAGTPSPDPDGNDTPSAGDAPAPAPRQAPPAGARHRNADRAAVAAAQMEHLAQAVDAYAAGDLKTALQGFEGLAYGGVAEAQYRLGRMLLRGEGEARDPVAALAWFQLAAEQGHARAAQAGARLAGELGARRRTEAEREAALLRILIDRLAGREPAGAPAPGAPVQGVDVQGADAQGALASETGR